MALFGWTVGGSLALLLVAGASFAALNASGPTTAELESDISEVQHQIEDVRAFSAQYGEGSPIRGFAGLRLAILETTKAMLDQKRKSWLRGVNITFVIKGNPVSPV